MTSLILEGRQHQALTPRLQYAVRLLQLSSLDYEQELHDVVVSNPFLDVEERFDDRAPAPFDAVSVQTVQSADAEPAAPGADASEQRDPELQIVDDGWQNAPSPRERFGEQTSLLDSLVANVTLRQFLRGQANLLPLSDRDRALVCATIESLDDDGYLRVGTEEIAELTALDPPADACEMSTALKLVQSFEPTGVAARSVSECLLLQLGNNGDARTSLCRRIARDHLAQVAAKNVVGLARELGCSAAEVEEACAALRRLDPRPGARFGQSENQYVKPDVIVRKRRGKWTAELNPAIVPRLRLNQAYAELFQHHRDARHTDLGTHLKEARWTLRNMEQRFSTILAVAQAIVRRQHGYFDHGPLAMRPLGLKEVAQELGVHESTVSRVTNNKYMATPSGLIELKRFFSRPMAMAGGRGCSPTAVRGLVEEIIAAEDRTAPLSDVEITRRLVRQGLTVARRTVTKYRQSLKIPSIEQRRLHAVARPPSTAG